MTKLLPRPGASLSAPSPHPSTLHPNRRSTYTPGRPTERCALGPPRDHRIGDEEGWAMMRSLPGSLDPGAPPLFASPVDVIAWVRGVDWLLAADRAVVLHVDDDRRLTCVASSHSPLKHLGPRAKDALVADALQCGASAVLAVDLPFAPSCLPPPPARSTAVAMVN